MGEQLTQKVDCGAGAVMSIVEPRSLEDGGVEWRLRYSDPAAVRFAAASLIESYDYLISDEITMTEATRRLRLLRAARKVPS